MIFKKIAGRILFGCKCSPEAYASHLRKKGAKIGDRTTIFAPRESYIDETRPWLLDIGADVQITRNVTILTHGYDWSVLKGMYGDVLGSSGRVTIGNNVFIGMNSTVLKGVTIGKNVVIGANSLVNKDIPDNVVAAGNPVKVICSIEDYYKKRIEEQLEEAKELAITYYERYRKIPPKNILSEFFWLFEDRELISDKAFEDKMKLVGNYDVSMVRYRESEPLFGSYDEFLKYCEIGINK